LVFSGRVYIYIYIYILLLVLVLVLSARDRIYGTVWAQAQSERETRERDERERNYSQVVSLPQSAIYIHTCILSAQSCDLVPLRALHFSPFSRSSILSLCLCGCGCVARFCPHCRFRRTSTARRQWFVQLEDIAVLGKMDRAGMCRLMGASGALTPAWLSLGFKGQGGGGALLVRRYNPMVVFEKQGGVFI
jgi:hypothetical protein